MRNSIQKLLGTCLSLQYARSCGRIWKNFWFWLHFNFIYAADIYGIWFMAAKDERNNMEQICKTSERSKNSIATRPSTELRV
ncbi:hypothetical protein Leryth_017264 [Lithospermum erythrorhizon]|nr:hypothetical protein Leryth_017264 [Lithospermum erythrorhizon]